MALFPLENQTSRIARPPAFSPAIPWAAPALARWRGGEPGRRAVDRDRQPTFGNYNDPVPIAGMITLQLHGQRLG